MSTADPPGSTATARRGVLRNSDFFPLWLAQTVSLFGSQVSLLAIPLTAVLLLDASPTEMGLLTAAEFLPGVLLTLFIGVVVDRMSRRKLLIRADLGRAVALAAVPALAWSDSLRIEHLYFIGFIVGILTALFDVAYLSLVPRVVPREDLADANAKLALSQASAQVGGPTLCGVLVSLVAAPAAIVLDACSFLFSAAVLRRVPSDPPPTAPVQRVSPLADISVGLRLVIHHSILRAVAGASATLNFFVSMIIALLVLFLTKNLELPAAAVGLVLAAFGPGALAGAALATRVANRIGIGKAAVAAISTAAIGDILLPISPSLGVAAVPVVIGAMFLIGLTGPVYTVPLTTLRQTVTPDHLQGRINATMRFLVVTTFPLGAVAGGALGSVLGVPATLAIAALGVLSASIWLLFSPVLSLRTAAEAATVGT